MSEFPKVPQGSDPENDPTHNLTSPSGEFEGARGRRSAAADEKRRAGRPRASKPRARAQGDEQPSYLTERQKEVLDFIADYQNQYGISPTHREIREHFGYSSFGTVYKHLKLLQQKGYLNRDWNQKRGLELVRAVSAPQPESEVPFLGLIAAGQPIEALPGNERLSVPQHLFGGDSSEHYVLRVVGESMIQEGIHDGDFVIVLRRQKARPGEMVVALVDGVEATLKRFFPEGDQVRLEPSNPEMLPIVVPASSVQVQGVVVGLMRKY